MAERLGNFIKRERPGRVKILRSIPKQRVVELTKIGDEESIFSDRLKPEKKITRHGREKKESKREQLKREEEQALNKELLGDYDDFITRELKTLISRWHKNKVQVELELNDPELAPYKVLWEKYTEEKPGSGAGERIRYIKTEAFDEFKKSESGLAHIYEIRKWRAQQIARHSGALLDSNLPPSKQRAIDDTGMTVKSGGIMHEILVRRFGHWLREPIEEHGRRRESFPKTKGGALAAGLPLSLLSGGLFPAGLGIYQSFKPGQRVDIKTEEDALKLAKDDSFAKKQFVINQFKINSDNLVSRNGKVEIRPDIKDGRSLASPSMDPKDVEKLLLHEVFQLQKFEKQMMGIPTESLGGDGEQLSQKNIEIDIEVETKWKKDPRNVAQGIPCQFKDSSGKWVDSTLENINTAYRAGFVPRDTYGVALGREYDHRNVDRKNEIRIRQEIRSRVIAERMKQDIDRRLEIKRDRLGEALKLDIELTGKSLEAAKEEITAKQKKLMEFKDSLTPAYKSFKSVDEELTNIETKIIDVTTAENRVTHTLGANANALDALSDITRQGGAGQIQIGGRVILNIHTQKDAALERYRASLAGIQALPANVYVAEREAIKGAYDLELSDIKEQEDIIRAARKAITDKQEEIDKSYEKFNEEKSNDKEGAIRATEEMKDAFNVITNFSLPARGIDLSEDELCSQPYDELMDRIVRSDAILRAAHAQYLANGGNPAQAPAIDSWGEAEKNKPENRRRLYYAIAEAKARRTPRSGDFIELTDNNGEYKINEVDLLTSSPNRLGNLILRKETLNQNLTPGDFEGDIEDIQNEARNRFNARMAYLNSTIKGWDDQNKIFENQKTNMTVENIVPHEIFTIQRAISRYNEIGEEVNSMSPDKLIECLSTDHVGLVDVQSNRFLPAEQGETKAYAKLMQIVFDHRNNNQAGVEYNGETGKGAAFRRNCKVLDYEMWRRLLVDKFNLQNLPPPPGIVGWVPLPANPINFDNAIDLLRVKIENGEISKAKFAEFLQQDVIMNDMVPYLENMVVS
jgi:hypothetical protein